jgi:hypothetical protein
LEIGVTTEVIVTVVERISKTLTKTSRSTATVVSFSVRMAIRPTRTSKRRGGGDGHLAVTHSDTYVIGDAHTDTCENRHSFLRQPLAKFRGVSKHHLQKYLNFCTETQLM